jgi:hypothetical protein
MLASLPSEDPPRSFRLSPAQAAAPARPVPRARAGRRLALRAMPALAAVAAVAFVALVGVDVLRGNAGNNATSGPELAAVREAPSATSSGGQDKALAPAPSSAQAPENSSSGETRGSALPASPPTGGALTDSASNATSPAGGEFSAASGTPAAPAPAPAPRSAGTSATTAASSPVEGNAQASGAVATPAVAATTEAARTSDSGSGGGVGVIRWAEGGTAALALLLGIGAVVLWRRREED